MPGGGAAVTTVGLSGAYVAVGVNDAQAVAAVLTMQLLVSYLPAIPGWFATRDLVSHGYL